jgi:predicted permease
MSWYRRIRNLIRHDQVNRELELELSSHIAQRIEDLVASGMNEDEARRVARQQFGNYALHMERTRSMKIPEWIGSINQDVRYAIRSYAKTPAWTFIAVASLILGIGANVAVFTLLNAVLFRELPVPRPKELVEVAQVPFPVYRDLRERQNVFTDILATTQSLQQITIPRDGGQTTALDNVLLGAVSSNYFHVLDLQPVIGRFFEPEDDKVPGSSESAGSVIVLSDAFWQRQFGRDPSVLGRTLLVGRSRCRIIGVAPEGFTGTRLGTASAAWVPIVPFNDADLLASRGTYFAKYMARLQSGLGREQAQVEMTTLYQQQENSQDPLPLTAAHYGGYSGLRDTYSQSLWVAMGVVMLVHIIACANVANLLLARAAARRREIGVRLAIGCSRTRLIRQMLTESTLLCAAGGAAGIGLAYWASRQLTRMIDSTQTMNGAVVPLQLNLDPDWRVLAFLSALGILTTLGFGLVPALRAKGAIRSDAAASPRQRLSQTVVALQIALSLLLVIPAGLLTQTIYNFYQLDKGFNPENVVLFELASNASEEPTTDALIRTSRDVPQRVQRIPGVDSASVSAPLLPFEPGSNMVNLFRIPDFSAEKVALRFSSVSPQFLELLGITLVAGRSIAVRDTENAPLVAVINASMARKYFPAGAVGRIVNSESSSAPIEIVGVVHDSRYNSLREQAQPLIYLPIRQNPMSMRSLQVKTRLPLSSLVPYVREALLETDPDLRVRRVVTMSDQVAMSFSVERMTMQLSVLFGGLAILLACIGVYGIMSHAVARRTSEIGIRMALGATESSVLRLVLRGSFVVILCGIVIGLPIAWFSTQVVRSFLFQVTASDPATTIVATILLLAAAALAAFLPARRASRVDPIIALRHE